MRITVFLGGDNQVTTMVQLNPFRDTLSVVIAASSGPLAVLALGGIAAKKAFIADDSSFLKLLGVGLLTSIATGGIGLFPYIIAAPGAEHELQSTKSNIIDNRN